MNALFSSSSLQFGSAALRCARVAMIGVMLLATSVGWAQTQFQGVCAQVKIEIQQELAFERIGFEATLELTNNLGADPITDFSAQLTFRDPKELVNGQPKDVSDRFFVQRPRLTNVNAVDGSGVVGPTKTAIVKWFIIPKPGAGGILPQGKQYEVGCDLNGRSAGVDVPKSVMFAIPDIITVKPEPELEIRYFQPRDVQGDDPFTPEVETPIPFTLGVLVKNAGYGPAKSVRINSQQPKIVENKAGLVLIARLLGVRVQDSALDESSLTVNLGDILPGGTRKGAWDMITSLSGEFVEFKASYSHRDELGGLETSLIRLLEAHFIAHEVLDDRPGSDSILDFLADTDRDDLMLPDTLYGSDGAILPVNAEADAAVTTPLNNRTFVVTINRTFANWGYVRLTDPGQAKLQIASIVRQDGKVINLRNTWTNIRYRPGDNAKLTYFNLLDNVPATGTYTYTVTYANPPMDTEAPVTRLRFVGHVTESGGNYYVTRDTELYFTSDDASPVSIVYRLEDDDDFRPAIPFKLSTVGTHLVRFRATDSAGNIEETKVATVILQGDGPSFGEVDTVAGALTMTGGTLSFRPNQIELSIPVNTSNVAVNAQIDVFRGIRVWPTIAGVPVSPTPDTTTALAIGGENVDFYKYRLNGSAWSSERAASMPLSLTGLTGSVTVDILARAAQGIYPDAAGATTVGWTIDPTAIDYSISGLPAIPTRYAIGALTVNAPGIDLYRWKINDTYWRPQAAPGASLTLPLLPAGQQSLALIARRGDTWQTESAAAHWSWNYDPNYGSNFDALPLVYTETFPGVEGTTIAFDWDGRDNAGVAQLPGWYSVRVRLTDAVGNSTFLTRLVRIDDLLTGASALTDTTGGAEKPDARGLWLVWQDQTTGTPNIRARNLGTGGGSVLNITEGTLAQQNPRTDGRQAVWQGRRTNGNWDVMFVDLTDPTHVVALTDTADKDEINPVIDWPWVVWQVRDMAAASAPWQLKAANLETGQLFTVDATSADQLEPAVRAGRVVWQDFRDVGYGEIYFRDLETGAQRRITNHEAGQYAPDIEGHWIVWQDNRNTQVDIYGMDLRRGTEIALTSTPANEARPRVLGDWVSFTDDSAGVLTDNFVLLDLSTQRAVPLTRSATKKSYGSLAGGQLIWQEGVTPQGVVTAAALPALQSVFRNHNAVVVTPALVAQYGNAASLLAAWHAEAGVTTVSRFTSYAPLVLETVTMSGGAPTGSSFSLVAGDFIWVRFDEKQLLDLGAAPATPLDLPAGTSVFTHTQLPLGYTGHALARSLGLTNVRGLRMLDAEAGLWRVLAVEEGAIIGADFRVPPVAVVIVDLAQPVNDWTP